MDSSRGKDWANANDFFKKTSILLSEQAEVVSGPIQLGFDITNRCMMKCAHCFNRSSTLKRDELSNEEVSAVFEQIAQVKPHQICICGGEPLLRRKLIVEGCARLNQEGIAVGMVTNGYLINKKVAKELASLEFGQIQISLDGFKEGHERNRGKKGSYDRAVAAIENLLHEDVNVITSFAPTSFNLDDFPEYVEFVKDLGVSEVRIQPLMLLGESFFNTEIFPSSKQYSELVRFIKEYNYSLNRNSYNISNINEIHTDQNDSGQFTILWGDPVDHIIRFSKEITRPTMTYQIGSDGKLYVSPYFPLTVGNIKKHALKEYWEAGLNRIWEYKIVQFFADQVRCIQSMGNLNPSVFFSDHVEFDLVENTEQEIDQITEDLVTSSVLRN